MYPGDCLLREPDPLPSKLQESANMIKLRVLCPSPSNELLLPLNDNRQRFFLVIFRVLPAMRQVWPQKHQITLFEVLHSVAHVPEIRSASCRARMGQYV